MKTKYIAIDTANRASDVQHSDCISLIEGADGLDELLNLLHKNHPSKNFDIYKLVKYKVVESE